jgi:hypothetical protein
MNLLPGKYRLLAARAGGAYSPAEYGQRHPRGRGTNFEFTEGQSIVDLNLPMAANGTISGRVLDSDGTPAAHVRMLAMEAFYKYGRRLFGLVEVAETDDHGEYRLYYLPPGHYYVAARPEDQRRRLSPCSPRYPLPWDLTGIFTEAPISLIVGQWRHCRGHV